MHIVSRSHLLQRFGAAAAMLAATLGFLAQARADEKFTLVTNWFAQAEHGGFYQALATGLYRKQGLDVKIRMGGPQVNSLQILAAGQADCAIGSSNLQMIQARANGLPVVTVAAFFQKDPQVLIAHDDVKSFADMKGKTILIAAASEQGFWPWLKTRYGFTDSQTRPYTFNIQPFVADHDLVQQGYITSEPYALRKAGVRTHVFLFADYGYPAYATTISCMERTLTGRSAAVRAFLRATAQGWKSYLANPAAANVLIKKDNPNMTDDQLAYGVARIREYGLVGGGDAKTDGIGTMTRAKVKTGYDFLVANRLIDPSRVKLEQTTDFSFMRDIKVLP